MPTGPRNGSSSGPQHRAEADGDTRSYIKQFETEIADFDALATAETIAIDSIADIGLALIRARVASGLTQAQLAERVGLHTAAINRYETNNYRTANLTRLNEIADSLDFDLAATLQRRKTIAFDEVHAEMDGF